MRYRLRTLLILLGVMVLAIVVFAVHTGLYYLTYQVARDAPVPAKNEVAMSPGMTITATTPTGTIVVSAGKGLKRSYTWDGASRYVEMWPRSERWYGSLGLYFPGPGYHWKSHNGVRRGVLEEGQQHFKTLEEALHWIDERDYMPFVYRNDGLMVGWSLNAEREQLDVEVWQIYINGNKPTTLRGSHDDKIIIEQNSVTPIKGEAMFCFSIRDVLWLTVVVGLACAFGQ